MVCPHCEAKCSRAWEDARGVVWRCRGPEHHVFRVTVHEYGVEQHRHAGGRVSVSIGVDDLVCPHDGTTAGSTCIDPDDIPVARTCAQCGHTWVLFPHEPTSGCPCFQCRVTRVAGEGGPRTTTKERDW
jgi:hypothetical protein